MFILCHVYIVSMFYFSFWSFDALLWVCICTVVLCIKLHCFCMFVARVVTVICSGCRAWPKLVGASMCGTLVLNKNLSNSFCCGAFWPADIGLLCYVKSMVKSFYHGRWGNLTNKLVVNHTSHRVAISKKFLKILEKGQNHFVIKFSQFCKPRRLK